MKKLNKMSMVLFGVRLQFIAAIALFAFIATSQLGCAQLKERSIASDIETVTDVATVVCDTAKLFASQGIDIPGIDKCDVIVSTLNKEEIKTIVSIMSCRDEFGVKSVEFADCAVKNGWPVIREKLKKIDTTSAGGETVIDMSK